MQKWFMDLLWAVPIGSAITFANWVGWSPINVYSNDPNKRIIELLDQSEDLAEIEKEWEKFWFTEPNTQVPAAHPKR